jgi:hypothetical protein
MATKNHYKCVLYRQVCLDQNTVVSFYPHTHPKHSMGTIPFFNTSDIMYNLPSK